MRQLCLTEEEEGGEQKKQEKTFHFMLAQWKLSLVYPRNRHRIYRISTARIISGLESGKEGGGWHDRKNKKD